MHAHIESPGVSHPPLIANPRTPTVALRSNIPPGVQGLAHCKPLLLGRGDEATHILGCQASQPPHDPASRPLQPSDPSVTSFSGRWLKSWFEPVVDGYNPLKELHHRNHHHHYGSMS